MLPPRLARGEDPLILARAGRHADLAALNAAAVPPMLAVYPTADVFEQVTGEGIALDAELARYSLLPRASGAFSGFPVLFVTVVAVAVSQSSKLFLPVRVGQLSLSACARSSSHR